MATKLMTSRTHSTSFQSPEASPYSEDDQRGPVGAPKGWCSERVPLSSYRARRQVVASALMPFSSGRALPSKWDDAERWISSPVSVGNAPAYYGVGRGNTHLGSARRAKSKSGPLGPTGFISYGSFNNYSPVLGMGVINGGRWRNSLAVESPGSVQARLTRGLALEVDGDGGMEGGRRSYPGHGDPDWLDLWSGPLSPNYQGEENIESMNDNTNRNGTGDQAGVDRAVSRRDMATQMYQESESSSPSSVVSSPRSWISTNSQREEHEPNRNNNVDESAESEVRDVQVDKQTSTTRRSSSDRDAMDDNNYMVMISNSTIVEAAKQLSKLQREEARINAWENLQKAKAEAAIQKLEMKLEKKRTTTMEKIVEKLKRAQIKAQRMRSSLATGGNDDDGDRRKSRAMIRNSSRLPSFCRKIRLGASTRSCSTCYPF